VDPRIKKYREKKVKFKEDLIEGATGKKKYKRLLVEEVLEEKRREDRSKVDKDKFKILRKQ